MGTLTTNQTSRAANSAKRASDKRLMPGELDKMPVKGVFFFAWPIDAGRVLRTKMSTIATPLAGAKGDAARGKTHAFDPERGNCTICHPVPGGDARGQGTVGPTLAGAALRLSEGQIRLRVVDGTRINPATIMPPYHRVEGLNRVGREWAGKPVLSAQEVEDIVAFLGSLKE